MKVWILNIMNNFILFDTFLIYIINMLDEFSVTHYVMTHRDGFCDLLTFGLAMFVFCDFQFIQLIKIMNSHIR